MHYRKSVHVDRVVHILEHRKFFRPRLILHQVDVAGLLHCKILLYQCPLLHNYEQEMLEWLEYESLLLRRLGIPQEDVIILDGHLNLVFISEVHADVPPRRNRHTHWGGALSLLYLAVKLGGIDIPILFYWGNLPGSINHGLLWWLNHNFVQRLLLLLLDPLHWSVFFPFRFRLYTVEEGWKILELILKSFSTFCLIEVLFALV